MLKTVLCLTKNIPGQVCKSWPENSSVPNGGNIGLKMSLVKNIILKGAATRTYVDEVKVKYANLSFSFLIFFFKFIAVTAGGCHSVCYNAVCWNLFCLTYSCYFIRSWSKNTWILPRNNCGGKLDANTSILSHQLIGILNPRSSQHTQRL